MLSVPQRRSVVVLGELCAVLRLGLREVLSERGCRVVAGGASGRALRSALRGADAMVVDLDAPGCEREAVRLATRNPGLNVIGCSARRPAMRVFTAAGGGEERPLEVATLVAAIGVPLVA